MKMRKIRFSRFFTELHALSRFFPIIPIYKYRERTHHEFAFPIGNTEGLSCYSQRVSAMTLKIGVYLTDDVARRFRVALKRSGMTKSALVNEALAHLLDPPPTNEQGQGELRVLRAVLKHIRQVRRETLVLTETLALFIHYFLMITPPLPESEREAAEAVGRQRYEIFVRQIAGRIGSDKGLITDVMRTIVETHPELVARAAAGTEPKAPAPDVPPFGASSPSDVDGSVSHA
jgi:hypothetical protein